MLMGRIDHSTSETGPGPLKARSLAVLIGTMVDEILAATEEEQWQGFFRAIGVRLAQELRLDKIENTDDLVFEMNALWRALGWGTVSLELDDEGIDIYHQDMPMELEHDDAGHWPQVAPHILIGAYESWFRSLGSGSNLTTRILKQTANVTHLRHGL